MPDIRTIAMMAIFLPAVVACGDSGAGAPAPDPVEVPSAPVEPDCSQPGQRDEAGRPIPLC